ncbi:MULTISPECIES: c-type cytochrome [Candidatus Ichthyocystis]|uniref:c-type cytochrome n=1 Tax=Candidatus Ichthyocystis TaxID=2929841 RepID=UPI000B810A24|nr:MULTISPECIES: c-type cytochrome [Ichthyocystis]
MFRLFSTITYLLVSSLAASICWSADNSKSPPVNHNCAQCHGTDGNGRDDKGNWLIGPSIAGQVPEYITEQMQNFAQVLDKKGNRVLDSQGNPVYKRYAVYMSPLSNVLDENSMVNFGNMYHGYKPKVTPIKANPDVIALGEKIWRSGVPSSKVPACAACHGVVGQGMPKLFPRVGGQNSEYLIKQLKNFRIGKRPGGPNGMMKTIASRMTDEEIVAVSTYASGLDFNPKSDFIRS